MTDFYADPETGGGTPTGAGTEADPWNGLPNVVWGSLSGGGHTLNLSGTYTANRMAVSASGAAGNVITVTGGLLDGTAITENTQVLCQTNTYLRFEDIDITDYAGALAAGTGYAYRFTSNAGTGLELIGGSVTGPSGGSSSLGLFLGATDGDVEDILVDGTVFADNDFDMRLLLQTAGETGVFNNVTVRNISSSGVLQRAIALDYTDPAGDILLGRRWSNINVINNRIDDCVGQNISMRGTDNSRIAWNTMTNAGTGSGTSNAINPGADSNLVVEDNVVDTVNGTGTGDGSGIFVDRAGGTPGTESNNTTVRRNLFARCKKSPKTTAIENAFGINSVIEANIVVDSSVGIKTGTSVATGSLFNGNTIVTCTYSAVLANLSSAGGTCKNSILHTSGLHSVIVEAGSTLPTLSYNCYFGYTEAEPILNVATPVSEDGTSIIVDPKFVDLTNEDVRLDGDSPCIAAGEPLSEGESPQGYDGLRFYQQRSMGAFEVRRQSGYARKAAALIANTLPAGADMAKARAAYGS